MFCMAATYWYLLAGLLFLVMGVGSTALKRLPITTSIVYLLVGLALGPTFLDVLRLDVITHSRLLEHLSEAAVLISLFTAGLKLRTPLSNKRWLLPLRLAGPSMIVTVGLVTLVSVFVLGLPVGAGVLLGAVLAPTDPVLASDVQLSDPNDRDRLRFTLTGEAAINDGAAFPFVMLGLGLLGLHEMGNLPCAGCSSTCSGQPQEGCSSGGRQARWSDGSCSTFVKNTRNRRGSTTSCVWG